MFLRKILMLALVQLTVCTVAQAADPAQKACVQDANRSHKQNVADENLQHRLNVATCKFGPEVGARMAQCITDYRGCIYLPQQTFLACQRNAALALNAARQAARVSLGCGESCGSNSQFNKLVVEARIAFYSAQNACRQDENYKTSKIACRTVLGQCNAAAKAPGA